MQDMVDLTAIKSWGEAASGAVHAIKAIIGLLPSGKKREKAERLLAEAEEYQKHAEAALARQLGFEICEYCWPPEIVLLAPEAHRLECRKCHRPPLRVEQDEAFYHLLSSQRLNHNL